MPRREAFETGMNPTSRDYLGSGFTSNTYTVHQRDEAPGGGDIGVSSASLYGGYVMPDSMAYRPHPKISAAEDSWDPGPAMRQIKGTVEQGELFNWQHPKISGLYRSNKSPKTDTAAALGLAVNASRKLYGVDPEPDSLLSSDSAPLAGKLTGKQFATTHLEEDSKKALRVYGDYTASTYGDSARINRAGGGSQPVRDIPESETQAGSDLIRNKLRESIAARRAPVVNKVAALTGKLPDLKALKQNAPRTLPGM
ncbi:hypothetical protein UFOVP965_111 [uncultured Caudovirales phage]|uniref:Uncharacterized protein n=1 Tax=uncultured Caudovirales phage TaxID=2100421 RepID=A0A6J5QY87_9CAUD|nr:hypothetical protein UFOVP965_111 [uncultured Caudovirales phage]CAB4179900.1 hypothetical protein UFOVP1035_107 [uncultured Caudovirales phage]CAB4188722.1 hypothetical protein UFOVP1181_66 [uncultured Caudovirales phage]